MTGYVEHVVYSEKNAMYGLAGEIVDENERESFRRIMNSVHFAMRLVSIYICHTSSRGFVYTSAGKTCRPFYNTRNTFHKYYKVQHEPNECVCTCITTYRMASAIEIIEFSRWLVVNEEY